LAALHIQEDTKIWMNTNTDAEMDIAIITITVMMRCLVDII
jgi:hypothetical protein